MELLPQRCDDEDDIDEEGEEDESDLSFIVHTPPEDEGESLALYR